MERNTIITLRGEHHTGVARIEQRGEQTCVAFSIRPELTEPVCAYLVCGAHLTEVPLTAAKGCVMGRDLPVEGVILAQKQPPRFLAEGGAFACRPNFPQLKQKLRMEWMQAEAKRMPQPQEKTAEAVPIEAGNASRQLPAENPAGLGAKQEPKAPMIPPGRNPAAEAPREQRQTESRQRDPIKNAPPQRQPPHMEPMNAQPPEIAGQDPWFMKEKQREALLRTVPPGAQMVQGEERTTAGAAHSQALEEILRRAKMIYPQPGTNESFVRTGQVPPAEPLGMGAGYDQIVGEKAGNTGGQQDGMRRSEEMERSQYPPQTPMQGQEHQQWQKDMNQVLTGKQAPQPRLEAQRGNGVRQTELIFNPFPDAFPRSSWKRVSLPGTGRFYLEGEVRKDNARLLVQAQPGEFTGVSPLREQGFTRFLRAVDGSGYWLRIRKM